MLALTFYILVNGNIGSKVDGYIYYIALQVRDEALNDMH